MFMTIARLKGLVNVDKRKLLNHYQKAPKKTFSKVGFLRLQKNILIFKFRFPTDALFERSLHG